MASSKEIKRILKEAIESYNNKDIAGAESQFRSIIEKDPDNCTALLYLSACLDNDEIITHLKKVIQLKPDNLAAWKGLGKFYETRMDQYPWESLNTFQTLADFYQKPEDTEKLILVLKNILDICLQYPCDLHWSSKLLNISDEVLKYDPNDVMALETRLIIDIESYVVSRSSCSVDFESRLDRLKDSSPDSEVILFADVIVILQSNNISKVLEGIDQLLDSTNPPNSHYFLLLAILSMELMEFYDCYEYIAKALEVLKDPSTIRIFQRDELVTVITRLGVNCAILSKEDSFLRTQLDHLSTLSKGDCNNLSKVKILLELDDWTVANKELLVMSITQLSPEDKKEFDLCQLWCTIKQNTELGEHFYNKVRHFQSDPESSLYQNHTQARLLYEAELFEEAKSAFTRSIERNPLYFANNLYLGHIFCHDNLTEEAEQKYAKAFELFPHSYEVCCRYVTILNVLGKTKDCSKIFEEMNCFIHSKEMRLQMGLVYTKLKIYDKAVIMFQQALKLDPKNSILWECNGDAYMKRESLQNAIKSYNKSIMFNPESQHAYIQRGRCEQLLEDYDNALCSFEKVLETNAFSLLALKGAAEVYLTRAENMTKKCFTHSAILDINQSLVYLDRAYKVKATAVPILHLIGFALSLLYQVHDPKVSLIVSEVLMSQCTSRCDQPDHHISIDAGLDLAAKFFARCIQLSCSTTPQPFFCLALTKLYQHLRCSQDKFFLQQIEMCLKKAIQLAPDSADYWNSLGVLYRHTNDSFKAQHCFLKTLKLDYRHANAGCNLGLLYFKQGRVDLAANVLLDCQAYNPESGECLLGLSLLGQDPKADDIITEKMSIHILQAATFDTDINAVYHICRYIFKVIKSSPVTEELQAYIVTAIDGLEKILFLRPSDYILWHDYGLLLQWIPKYRQSLEAFVKAMELSPTPEHLTIIKHSYMLVKARSAGLDACAKIQLDEPASFPQFCLQAYIKARTGTIEEGSAAYEEAYRSGSQKDYDEVTLREVLASKACQALQIWKDPELAISTMCDAVSGEVSEDVLKMLAALTVSTSDIDLVYKHMDPDEMTDWMDIPMNSDWTSLRAGLYAVRDEEVAGIRFLMKCCHREPSNSDLWFHLAVKIWQSRGLDQIDLVMTTLANSLALASSSMTKDHASFLKDIRTQCSEINLGDFRLLQIAAFVYPHIVLE